MGKEAVGECRWGDEVVEVKALLEAGELILRGDVRAKMQRKVAFRKMAAVRAEGGLLRFEVDGTAVSLTLGEEMAEKWAKAMVTPPPSLAKKLGITAETTVRMLGEADDAALKAALEEAAEVSNSRGELIVARADTEAELAGALKTASAQLAKGVPLWVVYPKGKGHSIDEHAVRSMGLALGVVDNKVSAVSERLTAMRFVRRRTG
jgi:hypothetical protein